MSRVISLAPAMALLALSLATPQPAIASGFSFDYTLGSHSISIVDEFNNHPVWSESVDPGASFTLLGGGYSFSPVDSLRYDTDQIANASAVSGAAALGQIGFRAQAVDPSGALHAEVQQTGAWAQMGGLFVIAGPAGTVDLKVRTTLNGQIGVQSTEGISNNALVTLEMTASAVDYNPANFFSSTSGWGISAQYAAGAPDETGLFLDSERISATGSYAFINHELTLTLAAVKTNQLFNLDLLLNASIQGPAMGGTVGDAVDFFGTYGMGYATHNPEQWFELPAGYSISTAPIPEPGTWALLLAGLGLLAWTARRTRPRGSTASARPPWQGSHDGVPMMRTRRPR